MVERCGSRGIPVKLAPSALSRPWIFCTPAPAARNGGEIKIARRPALTTIVASNRRNATGLNAQRSLSGSDGALWAGAGRLIWSSRGVPSEDTPVSVRWVERAPFRVVSSYVCHRLGAARSSAGPNEPCAGQPGCLDQGRGRDRPATDGVPAGPDRPGGGRQRGDRAPTEQRGDHRAGRDRAGTTPGLAAGARLGLGRRSARPGQWGRDAADGRGVAGRGRPRV